MSVKQEILLQLLRQFLASGRRAGKVAFVDRPLVASSFAEALEELELEDGPREVAHHVVVAANVEDRRRIQVLGLACHRCFHAHELFPDEK